jgi:hypothetical protein
MDCERRVLVLYLTSKTTGDPMLRNLAFATFILTLSSSLLCAQGNGNCDPVIHDKLVGAEWRSPSDCEVKYDQKVRQEIDNAFRPVLRNFAGEGWTIVKAPKLAPIDAIARHTETKPFDNAFTTSGPYAFELRASGKDTEAQKQALMDKMTALMKDLAKNQKEIERLSQQVAALGEKDILSVRVLINSTSFEIVDFAPPFNSHALPGGGTVVRIPRAQARTGGGADAGSPATLVLLGPWNGATGKRLDAESEEVLANATLNKARPLLNTQTVFIRIEGTDANAEKVLSHVDWNSLRSLLLE